MFSNRTHRIVAAAVAVAYIAVQSFQFYVFGALPPLDGPEAALLQGPAPLNLARALTMLLSFFGLAYLFLVVAGIGFQRRPALATAAFLGFFVFCLLEVQLRAIELFYVYLELPAQYQAATDVAVQTRILDHKATFESLQQALYFPLGLSWMAGSVLICFALGGGRFDWLAQAAFALNAVRLGLRTYDSYVLGAQFDDLYGTLYLPLVYLTFLPIGAWLVQRDDGAAIR